jgi:membrane fusion protein (multidrug efflux system)
MTGSTRRGFIGPLAVVAAIVIVAGAAAYGIRSRGETAENLQEVADDASIARAHVTSPTRGPEEQSLTLPGEVAAWNEAQIYGQVSGYISRWYKDYGAKVSAGDLLATIEAPSLDAEFEASKATLAVAQANYDLAEVTAKRFNALTESNAVSQQDIDEKNAQAAAQKAQVAAAQQNVEHYQALIGFKNVVSPFAGIVTARRVNIGDFVNAAGGDSHLHSTGQALFSVGDIHKLRIFVSVPQAFGNVLKPDITALIHVFDSPGRTISAQFLTTAGAVDRSTRTIVTEFVIDNPQEDLWPGAYVDVELKFPSDPNVLIAPALALLYRSRGTQIALLDDQDHVHLQDVTLGRNLGLNVEILTGVKPTDRIVANPSLGLLDGQLVKVVAPTPGYEPGKE